MTRLYIYLYPENFRVSIHLQIFMVGCIVNAPQRNRPQAVRFEVFFDCVTCEVAGSLEIEPQCEWYARLYLHIVDV